MRKVPASMVVTAIEATESPVPPEIQAALGELVGAAREGLLALSVGVGLGVVHELMELEVDEVVGPKGKHNPDRTAKRHGHENGSMTLGARRVQVRRPRMRRAGDEHELPQTSPSSDSSCSLPSSSGRGRTPDARCAKACTTR
jgi:putative transposase